MDSHLSSIHSFKCGFRLDLTFFYLPLVHSILSYSSICCTFHLLSLFPLPLPVSGRSESTGCYIHWKLSDFYFLIKTEFIPRTKYDYVHFKTIAIQFIEIDVFQPSNRSNNNNNNHSVNTNFSISKCNAYLRCETIQFEMGMELKVQLKY